MRTRERDVILRGRSIGRGRRRGRRCCRRRRWRHKGIVHEDVADDPRVARRRRRRRSGSRRRRRCRHRREWRRRALHRVGRKGKRLKGIGVAHVHCTHHRVTLKKKREGLPFARPPLLPIPSCDHGPFHHFSAACKSATNAFSAGRARIASRSTLRLPHRRPAMSKPGHKNWKGTFLKTQKIKPAHKDKDK